jgi:phosphoribosylaminoimidazole-succinocarboxamide synthase
VGAATVCYQERAGITLMQPQTVYETSLKSLRRIHQGKVRDLYEIDARHMLIVATDRLSAFDVILPDPIPGKGRILTQISSFWFGRTRHIVPNHLTGRPLEDVITDAAEREMLAGRAVIVRRLKALPIEAVVRGYLIGSGWKDYQQTGEICGIRLPEGLRMADRLPEPIFTPATKAEEGHDENISFERACELTDRRLMETVRERSISVYSQAAEYARQRGVIIADTKFEWGFDGDELILIDEALTPDSSRFWPADQYEPGRDQPSFDKQFLRNYLETLDWNKTPPGPTLPDEVVLGTARKYIEAYERLTGRKFPMSLPDQ